MMPFERRQPVQLDLVVHRTAGGELLQLGGEPQVEDAQVDEAQVETSGDAAENQE